MATITGTSAIKNNAQLTCTYSLTVTPGESNISGNYTPVSYSYYVLFDTNSVGFSGTTRPNAGKLNVVINGSTVASKTVPLTNGITDGTYIIAKTSGTVNVPHNDDGTKKLSYSISMASGTDQNNYNYVWSASSKSGSITLDAIPRQSTISSINGSLLGEVLTVNIDRSVDTYTHKVEYSFEGCDWATIKDSSGGYTGHGETCQFGVTLDHATYIPDSVTGTLTVRVTTYDGDTQIGSVVEKTKDLSLPSDIKPSITLTPTMINNDIPSDWGVYVKGHSQVKATIEASGVYGSTIKAYKIYGHGLNTDESSGTSSVLSRVNDEIYVGTVTDSRGRQASANFTITVVNYSPPSLSVTAKRCDSSGNETASGTYLRVVVDYSYDEVNGNNSITSKSVKCNGAESTSFGDNVAFILSANCSVGSRYTLTATVADELSASEPVTITIPTATRIMNVKADKTAVAFGKFAENSNSFEVGWDANFEGDVDVGGNIALAGEMSAEGNVYAHKFIADNMYGISAYKSGSTSTQEMMYLNSQNQTVLNIGATVPNSDDGADVVLGNDGSVIAEKLYLDGTGSSVSESKNPIVFRDSSGNVKAALTPGPTGIWAGATANTASVGFDINNKAVCPGNSTDTTYCGLVGKPWSYVYGKQIYASSGSGSVFGASLIYGNGTASWIGFYDSHDYAKNMNSSYRKGWMGFDNNSVNFYFYNGDGGYIGGNKAWTNASDRRLKDDIEDLPDVFVDIWMELQPKMFKWNDLNGPDGKIHFGLIAQDVMETFDKYGLDYKDYGIIGDFKMQGDDVEYYAITYEHYNMMTAAVVKKQQKEINELKTLVKQLLNKEG